MQAPDWYAFFLLGISILASILTYRIWGAKKSPANTVFLPDSKNQAASNIDKPIESFTPEIPVITGNDEIPELQGDYAKALFLHIVASSGPVKNDDEYPQYITYECGIQHPQSYHTEMIRQGYLEEDSVEKAFMYLKVPELKTLAAELGISSVGKKADLISHIISSADQEFIVNHCPITFSLSGKGKNFLAEHDAYIQLHRHRTWGISWKDYDASHINGEKFENTIMSILRMRAANDMRLFGRQEYFSMYQLMAECGNKKKAIAFLLQVLYIDVSGICGMESYNLYKEGIYSKSDLDNWFSSNIMIAPGIINSIASYSEYYTDSIVEKLYSWELPMQICSKELYLKIVHTALDGTFNFDVITSELRVAYKQFVNQL